MAVVVVVVREVLGDVLLLLLGLDVSNEADCMKEWMDMTCNDS